MVDWTASMQQTFEFYIVDPESWLDVKPLKNVKTCSITRDLEQETLGSAILDITESVGECYIRVYLVTIQNGVKEKHPLGTFLIQTPSSSFDGKVRSVSMDAYTPLIELKEKQPNIGYYIKKGEDVMYWAHKLIRENARAPVAEPITPSTELTCDFVSDTNDNWLTFVSDLITAAYTVTAFIVIIDDTGNYIRTDEAIKTISNSEKISGVKTNTNEQVYSGVNDEGNSIYYCVITNTSKYMLSLDELGRILFAPIQETKALQPVWTYTDDNSSILYSEVTMDHDLYGIPNVVEILYSDGSVCYYSRAVNDDPNSPISTVSRGREIVQRVTNPTLYGTPSQEKIDELARQTLKDLSSVEYTLSYTHAYCPVRIGDCVRFNYTRAGLTDIKAKVISQNIKCEVGCPVTEKAVFTTNLWR